MFLFLVFVEFGHGAEQFATAWAGKFGIPVESPPVVSPVRGLTEALGTVLAGARDENCLGFVMNMELVVSQGILVRQSLVAALEGTLPCGPLGLLPPPPHLSAPGRHLGQLSSLLCNRRNLDLLCSRFFDLLCSRLSDLLNKGNLLSSFVKLDRSILRDFHLVNHHPFTIWVKGNADLHFDKS